MSYGLYDGDLQFYPQVPFFNLELMKLSTYYKRKRELVTLSTNFKPQMYSHFIVRQDYPSYSPYSTTLSLAAWRFVSKSKYCSFVSDVV